MPAESGSYHADTMIHCRHCNYTGQPMDPTAYFYDKAKALHKKADPFKEELGPQPLSSKMALVSLCVFVASVGATGMQSYAMISLAGFVMFSVFYTFLRILNTR